MNPDDLVEAAVSTIIIVVMIAVALTIWNQDAGMFLINLVPQFVQLIVGILIGAVIASLLIQLYEQV